MMKRMMFGTLAVSLGLLAFASGDAGAQVTAITPVDLDGVVLGAKIVGPVGPEVNASFVNNADAGQSLGDLDSSVSCPEGFGACAPPNNPAGTVYTYTHIVTPGVDGPNDGPFDQPPTVIATDGVTEFRLGFTAHGFNGVAGYSFSDAIVALGAADVFDIERLVDGSLLWSVSAPAGGWDRSEAITFFWQTTQPPSGPGGVYSISNSALTGSGAGPLPTVPEPGSLVIAVLSFALMGRRPKRSPFS